MASGVQPGRKLRPRAPVTVEPSHVSQLNCLQIAGIDPRRYLELLNEHDIPRAHVGRLRIVALEELGALLDRLATTSDGGDEDEERAATSSNDPIATAEDVDAVLARLGMRATRGGR